MPPRWVCVAIVVCWLGTNGWLLWQDVWPSFQPDQPPPFTIDLVDEVQLDRPSQTPWTVTVVGRGNEPAEDTYRAYTWVEREPDGDLYLHNLRVTPIGAMGNPRSKPRGLIQSLTSRCRVTRTGDLRSLETDFAVGPATASLRGEVRGDLFYAHYHVEVPGMPLAGREGDLDPVPVTHNGALFLSCHPPNRIRGLRPGQAWRVPSVNMPILSGPRVNFIQARVLPETRPLPGKGTPCLVIEYADEDHPMQTWVERDSGLVQRQDAVVGTERWVMQRDH